MGDISDHNHDSAALPAALAGKASRMKGKLQSHEMVERVVAIRPPRLSNDQQRHTSSGTADGA
jgi:hypothetical protein